MEKVSYVNENNELVSSYFDVKYRPEDNFALDLRCTSVLYALARYDFLRDNKSLVYLQDAFRMALLECRRPHHFLDVYMFLEKRNASPPSFLVTMPSKVHPNFL